MPVSLTAESAARAGCRTTLRRHAAAGSHRTDASGHQRGALRGRCYALAGLFCLGLTASACSHIEPARSVSTLADDGAGPPPARAGTAGVQRRAGVLGNPALREVSGLAASRRNPGILWALNDGGHPAVLYALSHRGDTLREYPVDVANRDWEDLASVRWYGQDWLLIADIGDNRRRHAYSYIHLLREPLLPAGTGPVAAATDAGQSAAAAGQVPTALVPALTLRFAYEDGPRDAESLAATPDALLILSKPDARGGRQPASTLYRLPRPAEDLLSAASPPRQVTRTAARIGTLGLPPMNLEARLIAALSGVDIRQPTALDINPNNDTAYLLSYRTIRRYRRLPGQTWARALSGGGQHVLTHSLRQAEALAVDERGNLWFTTESIRPALWQWPAATPSLTRQSPPM